MKSTTNELVRLAKWRKRQVRRVLWPRLQDIVALRRDLDEDFVIVTPGIRSAAEHVKDDQKRTLSAFEAIQAGADYIVVGRPIRQAKDPLAACRQIIQEITDGLARQNRT